MSTSPMAGASFSRTELLARAKNDPKPANFTDKLNEYYLDLVDQYQGATVGDIIATADQVASDAAQKAETAVQIVLGGVGVAAVGLVLGLNGFFVPLAVGLEAAGLGAEIVGGVICEKACTAEEAAKGMSSCTASWAQLMADEAKGQPAPAPAQPAPPTAPPEQPAQAPVAFTSVLY